MKKFKTFLTLLIVLVLTSGFLFNGCKVKEDKQSSVDEQVSEQTGQMMTEANKEVGMPNINNWNEKKLLRDLYELRDQEEFITYTYIINMHGEKIFLGKSIGFGLPASVQFSNPERMVHDARHDRAAGFTKQPEPNGLYMPEGLSATWVFLIDPEGAPRPVYVEPQIMVSPFKLH